MTTDSKALAMTVVLGVIAKIDRQRRRRKGGYRSHRFSRRHKAGHCQRNRGSN